MNTQKVKALAFDAYGTLFDVHSVISACSEIFPEKGPAISQTWRAKQLEYSWLRTLMGRYQDFWKVTEAALVYACRSLGLDCPPEARRRLMEAYLHLSPYPEVPEALRALAHYKRAILSNGAPRMLRAAVESAGLKGMFVRVLSVDQVRRFKPDPRVYALAPEALRVPKSAIGFISANFWDIAGAKAFGLRTFWVNRSGAPPEELGLEPDATLGSLADLPRLLRA
jgi:2-haloacid dehalogenase